MSEPKEIQTYYYENRPDEAAQTPAHVRTIILKEDTKDLFVFPTAEDMQVLLPDIAQNKIEFLYSKRYNRAYVNLKSLKQAYKDNEEYQKLAQEFEGAVLAAHAKNLEDLAKEPDGENKA